MRHVISMPRAQKVIFKAAVDTIEEKASWVSLYYLNTYTAYVTGVVDSDSARRMCVPARSAPNPKRQLPTQVAP